MANDVLDMPDGDDHDRNQSFKLRKESTMNGEVPREKGAKHAGDRERWWCELLGCDPGTHYSGMLERGERSRRRLEKGSTRRSSGERRPG
jgi:hypothetical protein